MAAALLVLAALLGQSPGASLPATTPASASPAQGECSPANPTAATGEIIVCAIKPEGYRIDPDVLKARREAHNHTRPKRPENYADQSCRVVGPAPCMDAPMISLIGAAATLAQMADRLSKGQEIGSMFVTDPQPTEYQLYVEAKREREAREAQEAAKAKSAAAKAAAQ